MGAIEFASKELVIPLIKALRRDALKHKEEFLNIGDEFFDPLELSSLYVEPNCQHYNPADSDEDDHAVSQIQAPVFKTLNTFFAGQYASRMDGNNQQIILADAGMGKTSLLVMLKLFHWSGLWPAEVQCKLLKLGVDSIKRINKVKNRANTILLLDSLDEDPLAWKRLDERLLELLDLTKNFRRVVITCRTQFFPEGKEDPFARLGKLDIGGFVCPTFYLSPFTSDQVDEYLEKRFPTTFIEKLFGKPNHVKKRSLQILGNMKSLRMRPFLLSKIDYLLDDTEGRWNEYSIYEALIGHWLNREVIKIRENARNRNQETSSLPDKQRLWKVCETLACWLFMSKMSSLTYSEYMKIIKKTPDIELIEELEHGSKSLLNKHSNGEYRFSHYSIQEFLVVHSQNKRVDASLFTPQMWSFVMTGFHINQIPEPWTIKLPDRSFLIYQAQYAYDRMTNIGGTFFSSIGKAPIIKWSGEAVLFTKGKIAILRSEEFELGADPCPDIVKELFDLLSIDRELDNKSLAFTVYNNKVIDIKIEQE